MNHSSVLSVLLKQIIRIARLRIILRFIPKLGERLFTKG